MVGPTETDSETWGYSSFNFRVGGCAWCHPGGGALEYDREGYRYDGKQSYYAKQSDGVTWGAASGINPRAANLYGDYFVFDPANAAANEFGLVSKVGFSDPSGMNRGVAEIDCLMCHLNAPYNNQARDYCMTSPGAGANMNPGIAATMGLTLSGYVSAVGGADPDGSPGVNHECNFEYVNGTLPTGMIIKSPKKEACALCHFPDASKPKGKGPADAPLDWTTFQKFVDVGAFTDSDTGVSNASSYNITKGRAEFGKRAESINDPANHDAHMSSGKLGCVDCHYTLAGDFNALEQDGVEIQPELLGVKKLDHQFAKGNNRPDGKNMDQLDNTVTCEACHVTFDHPAVVDNLDGTYSFTPRYTDDGTGIMVENLGSDGYWDTGDEQTISLPKPTHAAFPALHFDRIDCRTCHIPQLNFVKKQLTADYSTTPYPEVGIGRGQFIIKKIAGVPQRIGYRPLYMWQDRGHLGEDLQLSPIAVGSAFVWKDLDNGLPYAKRFAVAAAKNYRDSVNPAFLINSPQGTPGDTALIANTADEISGMVSTLQGLPAHLKIDNPSMNIYVNQFTLTHNVAAKGDALGGPDNGGCADCHSAESKFFLDAPMETDSDKPCYGQPEGCKGLVFMQPLDGGNGLQMTCDGDDCTSGTKRITNKISFACPDGSSRIVDLTEGVAHGNMVNNVIPQTDILCYSDTQIGLLTRAQSSAYFDNLDADIKVAYDDVVSYKVNFDAGLSKCPSVLRGEGDICTYDWDFGDANVGSGKAVSNTYADTSNYTVTLTVTDPLTGYSDSTSTIVTPREVVAQDVTIGISSAANIGTVTVTVPATLEANYVYINWGDGQKTIDRTIFTGVQTYNHTYAASGTYMIYSKARNSNNIWVVKKQYVTIP